MTEKFWICWVEDTNEGSYHKHPSLESAKIEAERLAEIPTNIGKEVYIMELIEVCLASIRIDWH